MELKEILKQVSAFFETTIARTREEIFGPDNIRDITFNQYMYLEKIKELNNPTYGQLAKQLGVSKPAITGIVSKLIELGYIKRQKSPNDNRSYSNEKNEKDDVQNCIKWFVHKPPLSSSKNFYQQTDESCCHQKFKEASEPPFVLRVYTCYFKPMHHTEAKPAPPTA